MKQKLEKIKSMMNNEPKLFVLLLILILFIIIFIIYRIADKYMNYEKKDTINAYTHVISQQTTFNADITINRREEILSLKAPENINLNNSIVYSKDKIIFPEKEILVLTSDVNKYYKISKYTYIKDNNLVTTKFKKDLGEYFIYNGNNLYFFINGGTLKTDLDSIELNDLVEVNVQKGYIEYYQYKENKIGRIKYKNNIEFKNHYYKVDLLNNTLGNEKTMLPGSTEYLENITSLDKKK